MPARIALGHIAPWELPLDALIMLVSIYDMIRPWMSVFLAAAGTLKLREGLRLGLDYIGTEHILLGMVRDNDGIALPILLGLGADTETIRSWAPRAARVFASALLLACATALIGYGNSAGKPTTTPPASDPAGLVSYSARAPSAVGGDRRSLHRH